MGNELPLWPIAGDVVVLERVPLSGWEIAVSPEAPLIGCESYDEAWTLGRSLAEQSAVDFWYARQPARGARHAGDELRLLGHFRR